MLSLRSLSATISAANLVATNTSTRLQACSLIRWRSKRVRLSASTRKARWVIAGFSASSGGRSIRTGSCKRVSARACTLGGKVAEKNRFCRLAGNRARMRSSSSAKPRSNRRSASSSTRVAKLPSSMALCATKSSKRPGVATTTSAPPRKRIICGLIDTPPNTAQIFGRLGKWAASANKVPPTCAASSRVGTKIKIPCFANIVVILCCNKCSNGKPNAAVLPEPVCAQARTSRPCRMDGMAAV